MAGANAINLRAKSYARSTAQNVGFCVPYKNTFEEGYGSSTRRGA